MNGTSEHRYEGRYAIVLWNRLEEIKRLHSFLEEIGEQAGWKERIVLHLILVCEELFTNTVSYGYPDGGEEQIRFTFKPGADSVEVAIEDTAVPFNPLDNETVDTDLSVEERNIGGLGVHLVKSLMSSVGYERTLKGNRLTMTMDLR